MCLKGLLYIVLSFSAIQQSVNGQICEQQLKNWGIYADIKSECEWELKPANPNNDLVLLQLIHNDQSNKNANILLPDGNVMIPNEQGVETSQNENHIWCEWYSRTSSCQLDKNFEEICNFCVRSKSWPPKVGKNGQKLKIIMLATFYTRPKPLQTTTQETGAETSSIAATTQGNHNQQTTKTSTPGNSTERLETTTYPKTTSSKFYNSTAPRGESVSDCNNGKKMLTTAFGIALGLCMLVITMLIVKLWYMTRDQKSAIPDKITTKELDANLYVMDTQANSVEERRLSVVNVIYGSTQ